MFKIPSLYSVLNEDEDTLSNSLNNTTTLRKLESSGLFEKVAQMREAEKEKRLSLSASPVKQQQQSQQSPVQRPISKAPPTTKLTPTATTNVNGSSTTKSATKSSSVGAKQKSPSVHDDETRELYAPPLSPPQSSMKVVAVPTTAVSSTSTTSKTKTPLTTMVEDGDAERPAKKAKTTSLAASGSSSSLSRSQTMTTPTPFGKLFAGFVFVISGVRLCISCVGGVC
jgi:hypothetical protein